MLGDAQRGRAAVAEVPEREMRVETRDGPLPALVGVPDAATGLVIYAHGAGSSRLSPRNAAVAARLRAGGLATVLVDLLTEREAGNRSTVFDVPLLARRLLDATSWADGVDGLAGLPQGYLGASTGAGAALWAAAERPRQLHAVVSRGGRPDLAVQRLPAVSVPTLLIVGERDEEVLALNRWAQSQLGCVSHIDVIPAAGHLFEETGALERVAELALDWFVEHLPDVVELTPPDLYGPAVTPS